MKKNLNDKVVVLDKDIYARLVNLAGIGAYEISRECEFNDLTRHARKFNPALRPAHEETVKEQEEKRAFERHQYFRARRMVSNRNGVHYGRDVNGCVTLEKYKREFYLLTHKNEAFPIHIVGFAPNYGKSGVKIEYLDPKHKELNFYGCETIAKHIVETVEEIPANFKRHYANLDLRTGNECCAHPNYENGECTQCGDIDPEEKCCEDMKLDYTGYCIRCGDTSARIEVEGEQPCCENEDRNTWGGGCANCGDPCL